MVCSFCCLEAYDGFNIFFLLQHMKSRDEIHFFFNHFILLYYYFLILMCDGRV